MIHFHLANRLSAAEEAISQVQSEQVNLRRQFDELCITNSATAPDESAVRRLEKLEHDLQHISAVQRSLSSELMITVPPITDIISLKDAVDAALKILDGGLHNRDILHVRKMRQKPSSEPLKQTSFEEPPNTSSQSTRGDAGSKVTPLTEEPPTTSSQSSNGDAGSKVTPLTENPPTTSSQSTSGDAGSRVTPLIVTLSLLYRYRSEERGI